MRGNSKTWCHAVPPPVSSSPEECDGDISPTFTGRVLVRLVSREFIEAQLRHDVRILGAEALIVFPRTRCGTSGIDQTTLGNQPPVPHFLCDQDFANLRSRMHLLISSRKTLPMPVLCAELQVLGANRSHAIRSTASIYGLNMRV